MMENLVCERSFERNALSNKKGCHKSEGQPLSRSLKDREAYQEIIQWATAVRNYFRRNEFEEKEVLLNELFDETKGSGRLIKDRLEKDRKWANDIIKYENEEEIMVNLDVVAIEESAFRKKDFKSEELKEDLARTGGTIRGKRKSKSKLEGKELFEKKNGLVYETERKVSTREGVLLGLESFRTGGFSSISKSAPLVVRENVSSELEELEKERNEVIENLEI